jgi:hypothetical protein
MTSEILHFLSSGFGKSGEYGGTYFVKKYFDANSWSSSDNKPKNQKKD